MSDLVKQFAWETTRGCLKNWEVAEDPKFFSDILYFCFRSNLKRESRNTKKCDWKIKKWSGKIKKCQEKIKKRDRKIKKWDRNYKFRHKKIKKTGEKIKKRDEKTKKCRKKIKKNEFTYSFGGAFRALISRKPFLLKCLHQPTLFVSLQAASTGLVKGLREFFHGALKRYRPQSPKTILPKRSLIFNYPLAKKETTWKSNFQAASCYF